MRGQRAAPAGEPPDAPVRLDWVMPELETLTAAGLATDAEAMAVADVSTTADELPHARRRWFGWKRLALGVFLVMLGGLAYAYANRASISPQVADFSRGVIGDENTARVESWFFALQDHVDQVHYRIFGGKTDPFADSVHVEFAPAAKAPVYVYDVKAKEHPAVSNIAPTPAGPPPMTLPATHQISGSPQPGEGGWSTAGLPDTTPDNVLMAKTFFHPDPSRPNATVGVLLIDGKRVQLHMTAGTEDPGGYRGVPGPGAIPQDAVSTLVAAFNGGFKGQHGNFGMVADGTTYVPLRNGLASLAIMKDGTLKMGTWGGDLTWSDDMVAVRQNAVLLVDHGEISPRTNEGNDTWGYVQVDSSEFITWRSAVGLTKDGNLIVAAGNSLSAATLAKALWAAGAWTAMQLDINSPYVLTTLFFQQPHGTPSPERFMDSMPGDASRFLGTQTRDFMWVTLKG